MSKRPRQCGRIMVAWMLGVFALNACADSTDTNVNAGPVDGGALIDASVLDASDAHVFDANSSDADLSDAGSVGPDPFPAPIGSDADGDTALGIGTGYERFVELRHGDPLRWVAGIQGGYHVWVSARLDEAVLAALSDEERRDVMTEFTLARRDGTPFGDLLRFGRYRSVDGAWELVGSYSRLPAGIRPSSLDGEPLHVVVRVTLPGGSGDETFEREVWVRSECCD